MIDMENVNLVSYSLSHLLLDFGLSKRYDTHLSKLQSFVGTNVYIALEVLY